MVSGRDAIYRVSTLVAVGWVEVTKPNTYPQCNNRTSDRSVGLSKVRKHDAERIFLRFFVFVRSPTILLLFVDRINVTFIIDPHSFNAQSDRQKA
jgi:hypothetical protein